MTRRAFLPLIAALSACGPKQLPPDLFPETVASVWRRTALDSSGAGAPPDPIPAASIRSRLTAAYRGPGALETRAYVLASSGVALDLVQRWKPSAGTVFFHRDNWFVVVQWQDAPRADLQAFIREIERRLGSGTK